MVNISQNDIIGFYFVKNVFYVIGGPTGSHTGGHHDTVQDKWQEILSQGYLSLEDAKNKNLILESPLHKNNIPEYAKNSGWFDFPYDFDPLWVVDCSEHKVETEILFDFI